MRQNKNIEKIEKFSKEITYIELGGLIYNREVRFIFDPEPFEKFLKFSKSVKIEEINLCLNSENPKIRALGLMCLYQTDNQKNWLRTADFLEDSALCFKVLPEYSVARTREGKTIPSMEGIIANAKELKVSDIANSILSHYFKQAGYVYPEKDLENFFNERKDLDYTAGFLKILKSKATGGISPFRKERQPLVDKFRKRINNLPNEIDRAIYIIYLSDGYELYSQKEKVEALKFLGTENTKKILLKQPPTTDPDLLNIKDGDEYNNFEYVQMCKWILLNSTEIFTSKDIPFLVERAKNEKALMRTSFDFPYWHIALANLDTANASEYLKSGTKISENDFERAELYVELWHIKGLDEADFIIDWIFNSYRLDEKNTERIDHFIHQLKQDNDLVILEKIINDDRIKNSMRAYDIVQLAQQVDLLKGGNYIDYDLISNIRHPLGLSHFELIYQSALNKYPNETEVLHERIEELIEKLRISLN